MAENEIVRLEFILQKEQVRLNNKATDYFFQLFKKTFLGFSTTECSDLNTVHQFISKLANVYARIFA